MYPRRRPCGVAINILVDLINWLGKPQVFRSESGVLVQFDQQPSAGTACWPGFKAVAGRPQAGPSRRRRSILPVQSQSAPQSPLTGCGGIPHAQRRAAAGPGAWPRPIGLKTFVYIQNMRPRDPKTGSRRAGASVGAAARAAPPQRPQRRPAPHPRTMSRSRLRPPAPPSLPRVTGPRLRRAD